MDTKLETTYRAEIARIEALGMMPDRPPGLEIMKEGLERLGLDIDPKRVIVVAGTNGKGSVSATLDTLLLSAGARTGLYTSPHLIDTTERVRLGGRDLTKEEFLGALRAVEERTQGMRLPLSHFEILTLIAVWAFHSGELGAPVDWAIYEVGLGGTWDATNAIPHARCVITSLAMDHENLLGRTLTEVAENKFGIVVGAPQGKNTLVVHTQLPQEVRALAVQTQAATQSGWIQARESLGIETETAGSGDIRYLLETPWGKARLNLPGARGAENTMTALTTFEALGFDPAEHLGALAHVRWPGRMERVIAPELTDAAIYLSGDHNPQGVQSLLELLPQYPRQHLHILVGIGKDKDADNILGPLAQLPDTSIYLTVTPFRGRTLEEYGTWVKRVAGAWDNPVAAFREVARRASRKDLLLVTGSLYLVGEIKGYLARSQGGKK